MKEEGDYLNMERAEGNDILRAIQWAGRLEDVNFQLGVASNKMYPGERFIILRVTQGVGDVERVLGTFVVGTPKDARNMARGLQDTAGWMEGSCEKK